MKPEFKIQFLGNLFVRSMFFKNAGDIEIGHEHTYDHTTMLAHGRLAVEVNGKRTEYQAPELIPIAAGLHHKLIALEAGTVVACLHAIHSKDHPGDIIDPTSVPAGVSPRHFGMHLTLGERNGA